MLLLLLLHADSLQVASHSDPDFLLSTAAATTGELVASAADAIADTFNLKGVTETHTAGSNTSAAPHTSSRVPPAYTMAGSSPAAVHTAFPTTTAVHTGDLHTAGVPTAGLHTSLSPPPPAAAGASVVHVRQQQQQHTHHKHPHLDKILHHNSSSSHSLGHTTAGAGASSDTAISSGLIPAAPISMVKVDAQRSPTSHLVSGAAVVVAPSGP